MRLDTAVRLVFYLTLALACACLSYAEIYFLWWMPAALALTVVLLWVAFRVEGRWALSHDQANVLAVVIALATGVWIIFQLPRSDEDLLAGGIPWPTGLLPHVGPLLVLLLLAKVFRPKKMADFWGIQTIGLMMVMLACILTGDPLFGVFLAAYLGSALWCLALFYWYREQKGHATGFLDPDPTAPPVPWACGGLAKAVRWTGVVMACGFLLFLLSPRPTTAQWNPITLAPHVPPRNAPMMETSGIDLTRTGWVTMSDRLVFSVSAVDGTGRPIIDLGSQQRWRGETLDLYDDGRWRPWFPDRDKPAPAADGKLPHLGADEYFLKFSVATDLAGFLVLADPVILEPAIPVERVFIKQPESRRLPFGGPVRGTRPSLFREVPGAGALLSYASFKSNRVHYRQVLLPNPRPEFYPAHHVTPQYLRSLTDQELPRGLYTFTCSLLERLPGLSPKDRAVEESGALREDKRIRVAQELCRYLSSSPEYTYTLNLQRKDENLDPTVDFLVNVKQGHCGRYAGALALMLRALGMPARVVQGYLGHEHQGNGLYYIRQQQAHSWVEVLVANPDKPAERYWLVLDPTPSAEGSDQGLAVVLHWLSDNWLNGRALWRELILDYDTDRQRQAVTAVWGRLSRPQNLARAGGFVLQLGSAVMVVLIGLACGLLARRFMKRRRLARLLAPKPPAGYYARLLAVLRQRCRLSPAAGQTPREFGITAVAELQRTVSLALADLPLRVVTLLYRARYGGRPLTAEEEEQVAGQIRELDLALKNGALAAVRCVS